jgi:hypothetical protein
MRVDKVYKTNYANFETYGRSITDTHFKKVPRVFLRIRKREFELTEGTTLELINALTYALEDAKKIPT